MLKELVKIRTLGELNKAGYKAKSIKEEIKGNLIHQLLAKKESFPGVRGYEHTVIPQIETAILAGHNIILLGLRGQAKTRLARLMVGLLDDYIPVIEGSEINDDPFNPVSGLGKDLIKMKGDDTPIAWLHKSERYTEKLATPDVSVADLIGDLDPIKAATLKLSYADEKAIHYGLIPRSNRGIFVINELPDLQPRIQVSLFNILQEGDIQIRGFKLQMPLDIQFVFTANPEDYTNRGSIITPLKDRIESQILTHYPKSLEISKEITSQEATAIPEKEGKVIVQDLIKDLIEEIAFEARKSEYVDQKSGVSARLTISAYENLVSNAERRRLLNNEKSTYTRISDLYAVIPAITGKVELVYEGEVEGISNVAYFLIGKAIRNTFEKHFPSPEKEKKKKHQDSYKEVTAWFSSGNSLDLENSITTQSFESLLKQVPGLEAIGKDFTPNKENHNTFLIMEFILHGLAEFSQLNKQKLDTSLQFKDLMSGMFSLEDFSNTDEE